MHDNFDELKAAAVLLMGPGMSKAYDIARQHCQVAYGGRISMDDIRIVSMPGVIGPYNRRLAHYEPSSRTIGLFMHATQHNRDLRDKLVYAGVSTISLSDALLHELAHDYQHYVVGANRSYPTHRDPAWHEAVRVACNNLWAHGRLTTDHVTPRRKGALFTDKEMHHFPDDFEERITAWLRTQGGTAGGTGH